VDEIRAAVDWFTRPGGPRRPVGVVGYGEGGLLAFYAAAADTRIDAAWVAGYIRPARAGLARADLPQRLVRSWRSSATPRSPA
jgi:dienelactone hydrolase